jgi:hypothetical protein
MSHAGDVRAAGCEKVPVTIRLSLVAFSAGRTTYKSMKRSDLFRERAENCLQLAERAEDQPAYLRYSRMAQGWMALAAEQDWLDGEIPPLPVKAA